MSKIVSYRILIKAGSKHYKLGTMIIKRYDGDMMYVPSQRRVTNSSIGTIQKIIDHLTWHKSGRVHLKMRDGTYRIFEEGAGVSNPAPDTGAERQKIKDIGFQEIVRDTVIDIKTLPEHSKRIDKLDVVFSVGEYTGSVQFNLSIVSGTHIAKAALGEETPVKASTKPIKLRLDGQHRALGWESGNADKLLQYGLYKYIGTDLKSGRRVFVAGDSKIKKATFDS